MGTGSERQVSWEGVTIATSAAPNEDGRVSGLLIVANLDAYGSAAQHMGGAGGQAPHCSVPSLGEAGAESSMDHFARSIAGYHAGLCDAAGHGARSMQGYVIEFARAGA